MSDYGHWDISEVGDFNPDDYFGFIYEVVNLSTGRKYIGKKQFRNKVTKKPLKGRKNRRITYKESDWKTYTTSSRHVNKDLSDGFEFSFTILLLCSSKSELTYGEANLQHRLEVLTKKDEQGNRVYYNGNIAGIKFICENSGEFSEERRRKISENRDYSKTDNNTPAKIKAYKEATKRVWYNDGKESYHVLPENAEEGWVLGRLPFARKEHTHKCLTCGNEYRSVSSKSRFCGQRCFDQDRRPPKVVGTSASCKYCGDEFKMRSYKQIYCSTSCKNLYYKSDNPTQRVKGLKQRLRQAKRHTTKQRLKAEIRAVMEEDNA